MIVARNIFLTVFFVLSLIWLIAYLIGGVGVFLLLFFYLLFELSNAKNNEEMENKNDFVRK